MAEAQEQYDFHMVLDVVWECLVDDLDLDPVLNDLEVRKVFRRSEIRDLRERNPTTSDKIKTLLQLVRDGNHTQYEQFKRSLADSGQEELVKTIEAAEKGEYKPTVMRKKMRFDEEKLLEVLKEDLKEYYREKESTMSVAPLVEQNEAEIIKFYVRPPMMAYNKPNAFGQKKQSPDEKPKEKKSEEKTKILSYRELLLNGNDPYKGIYVTADAGMGKTSFAKMLAVSWCKAHASKDLIRGTLKSHDIETIKNFDFLFLIKLRDFETCPKCSLDEMILEMIKSKLQHKSQYTEELLEKILCNKRCLIIVDGLDEWIHPEKCRRGEVIPHRRTWPKCTVLTTTRPWKLSSARLSKSDIDRQVEISQLDETTARELESRAIAFLIENQESQTDQVATDSNKKTVTDFENSVPEKILEHFLYIPFVLLQIICLWFGNSSIGKSLCEVYSNIIELTLSRWLVKTDSGHTGCKCEPSKEHENIKLKCMENNRHCQCYMPLLLKIGQLAFFILFNDIREKSLLFDRRQVLEYLSEEELEQCLKMGLLSQVKDTTSLSEVRLQLYFPHKTLHEFFSSLFIATNWNNSNTGTVSVKQTISNKCMSVSDILEMSEVFVFVCGLNPEVYSDISRHLATIVSTGQSVIDYRNRVELSSYLLYSPLLKDYQRMQISCFLECTRNQHPECKIIIEDMFLSNEKVEDEQQVLVKILSYSACSLKSLDISSYDKIEDSSLAGGIVRILEQAEFSCLERLEVYRCGPTWLQNVLTSAAHTLKYLKLVRLSLTDDVWSAISTLNNLRRLVLNSVQVSRGSLIVLTLPLLTEFTLRTCDLRDSTVTLTLPLLTKFTLYSCDLRGSTVTLTLPLLTQFTLAECDLRDSTVTLTLPLLTQFTLEECDLKDSTVTLTLPLLTQFTLYSCGLRDSTVTLTLPLLTQFIRWKCDLRDSTVTLSPEMTSLKTITLGETTVNIPCYRELFLSISKLPQHITVKLWWINMTVGEWRELLFDILGKLPKSIHVEMQVCRGPSEEEWRNIVDDMKASPAFCVTRTDWDSRRAHISFDTVVV